MKTKTAPFDTAWMEEAFSGPQWLRKLWERNYARYEEYMRTAAERAARPGLYEPDDVFQILSLKLWNLTKKHYGLRAPEFHAYMVRTFENAIIDMHLSRTAPAPLGPFEVKRTEDTTLRRRIGQEDDDSPGMIGI